MAAPGPDVGVAAAQSGVMPYLLGAAFGLIVGALAVHYVRRRGARQNSAPAVPEVERDAAPAPLTPRWREFVEISSDWLWEIDSDHRFIDIPGAPPIPSIAPSGLTGKSWEEVVASELPADFALAHRETMERHGPVTVTLTRVSPSGEVRYLELRGRPIFDAIGRFQGYRGIGREVSDRARLTSELQRSDERFHALVAQCADAYWEQDGNLRYTAITARSGHLADVAGDGAIGNRRWEIPGISMSDPVWAEHIARIKQIEQFADFRFARKDENGQEIWLEESGIPVFDHRGVFAGYCGITRNITRDQARQVELRSSEARYRASFEQAPVAMGLISADEQWLQLNQALLDMLGFQERDLLGQPVDVAPASEDAGGGKALRARLVAGEASTLSREVRYRKASGASLWCRETLSMVRGKGGDPHYFVAALEDISAGRSTLESLKTSDARFRTLFELAPEAMLASIGGRIRFANSAARRLICDSESESLDGVSMLALVHPDDRAMESERIEQFGTDPRQGALPPLPVRYQRQDGKPLKIEATGVRIQIDGQDAILYVLRDVARWLSAEQVLRESRAMYRDVVESVNQILFQTNAAGRLTFLNRAWRHITGFDGRLSIGQELLDFVVDEDRLLVERELHAIRDGYVESARFEFRLRTQTAGPCWVEATIRPLRDGQDQSVGTSGTLDDITDRKSAEQSQRNLNAELETRVRVRTAQLEASNRELEAFSYSVSHDLRAPLRAIDGFAQIVSEDYAPRLDQTGKEYLQRIRIATQRMARLIDDLIDLARLTRQTMKREKVNLSQMAEQLIADMRQESPDRHVDVHIEPNLFAAADRALIRVALDNLLRNAWKFTSRRSDAQIRFHAEKRDRQTIYCVTDNGAGFDMAFASKLFLPFHRLHGISEFAGTGIGLATVQRVIQRHEGKIWAESYPEKGASFYFTLSH